MSELQCHALVKKTGHRCKNVAATDGYCILHSKAFATATVAELPPIGTGAHETIEAIDVYDAANPDAGATRVFEDGSFIADFGVKPESAIETMGDDGYTDEEFIAVTEANERLAAASEYMLNDDGEPLSLVDEQAKLLEPAKGFAGLKARSQPTPRCTIKSCHMVRGHGGKHENGSRSVATCAAKSCRLPLNHPGEHGQPARERVRIGELTGKL